jgi:hypothetical protein
MGGRACSIKRKKRAIEGDDFGMGVLSLLTPIRHESADRKGYGGQGGAGNSDAGIQTLESRRGNSGQPLAARTPRGIVVTETR